MEQNVDYALEGRRAKFVNAISDYSESRWAAGWCHGVEEEIREQGGLWVFMAYGAGGWPSGYRGEDGWLPLSDSELALVTSMDGRFMTVQNDSSGPGQDSAVRANPET